MLLPRRMMDPLLAGYLYIYIHLEGQPRKVRSEAQQDQKMPSMDVFGVSHPDHFAAGEHRVKGCTSHVLLIPVEFDGNIVTVPPWRPWLGPNDDGTRRLGRLDKLEVSQPIVSTSECPYSTAYMYATSKSFMPKLVLFPCVALRKSGRPSEPP